MASVTPSLPVPSACTPQVQKNIRFPETGQHLSRHYLNASQRVASRDSQHKVQVSLVLCIRRTHLPSTHTTRRRGVSGRLERSRPGLDCERAASRVLHVALCRTDSPELVHDLPVIVRAVGRRAGGVGCVRRCRSHRKNIPAAERGISQRKFRDVGRQPCPRKRSRIGGPGRA